MQRLLQTQLEETVIWLAILAMFVAVAVYVVGLIRAKPAQHDLTASESMSKFRESHSRGELSDEEFRTIKSTLAEQLHRELKDKGETG